ncbi:MAG TPA: FMN-binding negative transcriptional regulator [Caldimonas sp.]|nr:FMN-binding negative transcriptional regulator [Caldimonas sp.]
MYLPAHFEERRIDVLHAFVREHPFALLVTAGADGPVANGLPFLLDAGGEAGLGVLRGHVARANPVWRDAVDAPSLVVFQGPDGYVSPSFYPAKAEHGKVVPTWNYAMVQARGRLRAIDDREWLRAFVARLTERHESARAAPWAVTDAPPDYVDTMLRAIVGVEIELTALVGKWKLTQNRTMEDRRGVAHGLEATADERLSKLARLMRDAGAA